MIKQLYTVNYKCLIPFLIFNLSLKASPWEYVGPKDSSSITAMYNWGNGHLIAGTDFIKLVGMPQKVVYISRDFGKTWDTLSRGGGLPYDKVQEFVYIGDKLYACINSATKGNRCLAFSNTFCSSTDSGKTWNGTEGFPGGNTYWAISKGSTIVAGNSYYVSKSTDGGNTWKTIDVKDNVGGVLVCYSATVYNDTIYAGCHQGLWISSDWGETWQNRGPNITTMFSIDFVGNIIYYGCQAGLSYHKNFGFGPAASWIRTLSPGSLHNTWACTINDSIVYAIVDPPNSQKTRLYCSYDSVKTFQQFWLENDTSKVIHVNKFFSEGTYIFALTKHGIYRRLINDVSLIYNTIKKNSYPFRIQENNDVITLYFFSPLLVSIGIHSINGRLIKKIMNNEIISSQWSFSLKKLKNIPANGLYLLIVKSDNKVYTIKIFLSN